MLGRPTLACLVVAGILGTSSAAAARDWYVAPGGSGDGSVGAPFGSIQAGLDAGQPGDVVIVAAGTYTAGIQTVRAGEAGSPITVRGDTAGDAVVEVAGRVLTISHPYHVFENLSLDGQYGDNDTVRIEDAGDGTVLRGLDIRRATRDCVDMGAPADVLIEGSTIHHCLNAAGGRTDAHGIVGGAVRDLTIRNTEIHTFSGDAVQFDPGRAAPGWDRITIEGCRFWLAPLPAPENGFPAGTVAGENGVDTKVLPGFTSHLTIRDTVAYGFGGGLITNMAAFNLKETVDAVVDRVTIYDSEIALRLRAPATVTVTNAVIYDVLAGVRYEDGIVAPKLYASTIGGGVTNAFVEASSDSTVIDGRDVLVLGGALPPELAGGGGSLAVDASAFVDAGAHDYHLAAGSPAIDTGQTLAEVTVDRDGNQRPHGAAPDLGAYERCESQCVMPPDAGSGGDDDDGGSGGGGCCQTNDAGAGWLPAIVLVVLALGLRRSRGLIQ